MSNAIQNKVVTVVGARPQFIKAAPVSVALRKADIPEYLIHTGQHYDYGMSQAFFDDLELATPDVNLGIGSGFPGRQTGTMLSEIEAVLAEQKPASVVIYGDTNSTLAGALAAVKLGLPICHVEAGLRSFNRAMPEETNRVLTDHCSDLLMCPTERAVRNLNQENIASGVHLVGDTMLDAVRVYGERAEQQSTILSDLNIASRGFALLTVHRPSNTDEPENLRAILEAAVELDMPVVFPIHPRTRAPLEGLSGAYTEKLARSGGAVIDPLGYFDMLKLLRHAAVVLTDSGGLQKEAYFLATPCVTMRDETEWLETVESGWNRIVGPSTPAIVEAVGRGDWPDGNPPALFGDGHAADLIVEIIGSSE